MAFNKQERRRKLKARVRKHITGTAERPRLSVFRSNKQIYAQLINDVEGVTLGSASSLKIEEAQNKPKKEQAEIVGKAIAELGKGKGISKVVFDRNGYLYHGRVKALADAARSEGLEF
ncbi:50S ribosomal protein L18 [Luteibaculum oceani]|uniref:Large ribosomal subunit protein uL18 n=1 Tax=Luteibaculum oceani TaxID=1294296 RepID=A0A5C6UYQ1_9FLAO|nr:50S ribosomal protein L18 [Luteibaculum oceani]TXC78427.1 50S ribosomal protein L18 [Luteibaculum oceani]